MTNQTDHQKNMGISNRIYLEFTGAAILGLSIGFGIGILITKL